MEQDTNQGERQDNNEQELAVSPEQFAELQKQVEALAASKQRVESESKEWKQKYQSVKSEKEQLHRQELEEKGNLSELVEQLKNDVHNLKNQNTDLKKKTLGKGLRVEVSRFANDAFDIEDVVRNLPKDVLEMDEDNLTFYNVQDAVAKVREQKPHLFNNRPVTGQVSGRPAQDVPKPKTFDDLTPEEQDAALVDALRTLGH